jgi:hypothetical protein
MFATYLQLQPNDDFIALARAHRACAHDRTSIGPSADRSRAGLRTRPSTRTGSGSGSARLGCRAPAPPPWVLARRIGPGSGSDPPPRLGEGAHRAIAGSLAARRAAIGAATVGAVLAYSANAAERDLDDLYVGLGGNPPTFNDQTKARFDDLVKEGERYQTLSVISFGIAAILGGIAAYRFVTDEKPPGRLQVTPTATPKGAGVSATIRF